MCEIFFGQQQKRKQFRISCQCDILLFRGKNRENSWLWLKSWFFAFKPLLLCIIIILKHNWLGGKILPPFFVQRNLDFPFEFKNQFLFAFHSEESSRTKWDKKGKLYKRFLEQHENFLEKLWETGENGKRKPLLYLDYCGSS